MNGKKDNDAVAKAWAVLREKLGTQGWTVSDAFNFNGFFGWGWEARRQWDAERVTELEAQLEAAQKDAAWQPIECNPKDCMPFLAFAEYLIDMDFNPDGIVEACWDGVQFTGCVWNGQQDAWYGKEVHPTHWKHRPKPPKQEQVSLI